MAREVGRLGDIWEEPEEGNKYDQNISYEYENIQEEMKTF